VAKEAANGEEVAAKEASRAHTACASTHSNAGRKGRITQKTAKSAETANPAQTHTSREDATEGALAKMEWAGSGHEKQIDRGQNRKKAAEAGPWTIQGKGPGRKGVADPREATEETRTATRSQKNTAAAEADQEHTERYPSRKEQTTQRYRNYPSQKTADIVEISDGEETEGSEAEHERKTAHLRVRDRTPSRQDKRGRKERSQEAGKRYKTKNADDRGASSSSRGTASSGKSRTRDEETERRGQQRM
jgi:hypothetical protein